MLNNGLIKNLAVYILSILMIGYAGNQAFADSVNINNFGSNYCQMDQGFAVQASDAPLCRGKGVYIIVNELKLAAKNEAFLDKCGLNKEECYFVFEAMSDYDDINFDPLILYPDVFPANQYYGAINLATTLGLVRGFADERYTPFHPQDPMTLIQALKVLLIGTGDLPWKEKFELTKDELAAYKPAVKDQWWYGRYLNFALKKGMIEQKQYDNPDQMITSAQLQNMIYLADPNAYNPQTEQSATQQN